MAKRLKTDISEAKEDENPALPTIKHGNMNDTDFILSILGIGSGNMLTKGAKWGKVSNNKQNGYNCTPIKTTENRIPDVVGMGAKDAVYLLQEQNVGVKLNGYGKVRAQSLLPGRNVYPGDTVVLTLRP